MLLLLSLQMKDNFAEENCRRKITFWGTDSNWIPTPPGISSLPCGSSTPSDSPTGLLSLQHFEEKREMNEKIERSGSNFKTS